MKNIQKVFLPLLILFITNFYSCSNPISPDEVDPRLVGEWYFINNNNSPNPYPETAFYGIQINSDKTIKSLGIETNTGKVAVIRYSDKKIIKANEGKLTWEYFLDGIGLSDTPYNYKFENEKLILSNKNGVLTYTKTKVGRQLVKPIICNLSFEKDSIFYENAKISAYPSAYMSKIPTEDYVLLNAEMDHAFLRVEINNFNGEGEYEIPYDKFIFEKFSGDVIAIEIPDSSSTGSLTIDNYDELNKTCSGTFYFTSTGSGYPSTPTTTYREGIFTVPVYK